jgi:hypothetical protein
MNTLLSNIINSVKRAVNNKQFIKRHGNRFLTCYDINSTKRYNGQVINSINPLTIKIRIASNGSIIKLKASDIQIINKDHKQLYNFKLINSKPVVISR